MRRVVTGLVACLAVLVAPGLRAAGPDVAAVREEIVQILQGLVRIDSENPPGNETAVAAYLKAVFAREGIPAEIVEPEPGRGSVIARLKGTGKKRPILLMAHEDTVGVERGKWTVDPFGGTVREGYLYGRGASDDKGMVAVNAAVLLTLHRLKVPLDRDVIFLADAGEEGTTRYGIDFLIEKHWDRIASEYALNEGGTTRVVDGAVQYVGVATTEKIPQAIRLVAQGTSGHGAVPRIDNPIVHLSAAVTKIGEWKARMFLNETTLVFFKRLMWLSPPEEANLYRRLFDRAATAAAQEELRRKNPFYASMIWTTVSPNVIRGGLRGNVIPAEAEAELDVRALPEENLDAFVESLRKLVDDPAVAVVPSPPGRPAAPPSPRDSELFHALERSQTRVFRGSTTVPLMTTGATDSAQLRAKGVKAYGLGIPATEEDGLRVHGNDERVSVEGLGTFFDFLYGAVVEVAGASAGR